MCQNTRGDRFIVEIQVAQEPGFIKRAQYYAAYIKQKERGKKYKDLYDSIDMKQSADKVILEGAFDRGIVKGREEGRAEGRAAKMEKNKLYSRLRKH
jgi:hypothetical protein